MSSLSGRHHLTAAALALVVSVVLHAWVISRIDQFPLPSMQAPERVRFTPIEMVDVLPEPPAPVEEVERIPLENPAAGMIAMEEPEEIFAAIAPPSPVDSPPDVLPLPPPPPAQVGAWPDSVVRQEVLAVPEMTFGEEISALPRTWIDQDIPRIDVAPDIQLPVEVPATSGEDDLFDVASVISWREGAVAGTPDWRQVMGGRGSGVSAAPLPSTPRANIAGVEGLTEALSEISPLEAIEDMLQVRVSGFPDPDGHLYFALQIERASEERLPVQPRDILFIQDSSGSMTAAKLDECRRGIKRWLDFMSPGDRFEILAFSDQVAPCFGVWQPYDAESRQRAFQYLDGLRAVGNTDVFGSLQSALDLPQEQARTRLIVLMTDGRPTVGVMDSSAIIETITRRNRGEVAIFSVGGGRQVNSFFLDLLSYRNRGEAVVLVGDREIPAGMERWARELRRPVLTDLDYRFAQIDVSDIYPKQLTHLYLDRPLLIHGRIASGSGPLVFQVVGRSGANWHDFVFVIPRDQIAPGEADLRRQWAWQKVYHMIGDYLGDTTPERLESIRAFSDAYGLVVPYGFSRALPRR